MPSPLSPPRLRTVLLVVNLLILLLPLGGIAILRLYEDELIRGTEGQLIALGSIVRDVFREEIRRQPLSPGPLAPPQPAPTVGKASLAPLEPIVPSLRIGSQHVLPPAADARSPVLPPEPSAVLAGARITPALEATARSTLAGIRVVDARGVVVATSRGELGLYLAHREEVAGALAGRPVSLLRRRVSDDPTPPLGSIRRGQRYRVFVALPVFEGRRVIGAVVCSRTPVDIAKALYLNRRPLAFGAAVLVIVAVLVSVVTAVTIARPVGALTRQAERVAGGERGAVVEVVHPGTREVARLSRALGQMARNLEQRADYIRTFAGHVSHEFKTPLTTIRGTVELLRDHLDTMSREERERFLDHLDEASGRLEHLVRRLLEQARADVLPREDERSDLAGVLEDAARHYRTAGLDVSVRVAPRLGPVRMARETLEAVVSNLLDNALQHGGPGVRVRVEAGPLPEDTSLVLLRVADDGPGISEANAARVFTPFFTTARERGGSGLGLSIVRSLVQASGGSIVLESVLESALERRPERGAAFQVRLPTA